MDQVSGSEWRTVILADAVVLFVAAVVIGWLWDRGAKFVSVMFALGFGSPVFFGIAFLYDDLRAPPECTALLNLGPCRAYESHWWGWALGWFICIILLVTTGIVVAVKKVRARRATA